MVISLWLPIQCFICFLWTLAQWWKTVSAVSHLHSNLDVYLSKTLAPPSGKIGHQSTTIKPQHKISSSIWVQVKLNRYHHINICHIGLLSKTVFCFSKYKSTNVVQSSPYLNHIIMTNTPTRTKVVREDWSIFTSRGHYNPQISKSAHNFWNTHHHSMIPSDDSLEGAHNVAKPWFDTQKDSHF